jgi:nitrogen-specific signal transduction histidine kinase
MQRERKKFMDIIDGHPDPTLSVNNLGFVTIINKAARKILRVSLKDAKNKTIDQLFANKQEHEAILALIDPARQIIEIKSEVVKIILNDKQMIEKPISIFKTESGAELIYTLVIHIEE